MNNNIEIRAARTLEDFFTAKQLILEYVEWLGIDLSFQNFDEEMNMLPVMYGEAKGRLYLAFKDNIAIGVAGLRQFSGKDCEVKRMFVKPGYQGLGTGKRLLIKCIETAKMLGYEKIKLDTADFMQAAIKLYTNNGFVETGAYRYNPHAAARFFELDLTATVGA